MESCGISNNRKRRRSKDEKVDHPFKNILILNTLIEFMNHATFKTARQVCYQWYDNVQIGFLKSSALYANFDCPNHSSRMQEFVSQFHVSLEHEYNKVDTLRLSSPAYLLHPTFQNWMSVYGKYIKTLYIGVPTPKNESELPQCECVGRGFHLECFFNNLITSSRQSLHRIPLKSIKWILMKWCPNLEELHILYPLFYRFGNSDQKTSPSFELEPFEEVKQKVKGEPCVTLRKLEIGTPGFGLPDEDDDVEVELTKYLHFQIFSSIKSLSNTLILNGNGLGFAKPWVSDLPDPMSSITWGENITTLEICDYNINPTLIVMLSHLIFTNLKKIHFDVKLASQSDHQSNSYLRLALEQFFETFAAQLEEIRFSRSCDRYLHRLHFPRMNEVKLLSLDIKCWRISSIKDFLNPFPNLVTLDILRSKRRKAYYVLDFNFIQEHEMIATFSSIKSLTFQMISLDERIYRSLVQFCPNLEHLTLYVSQRFFKEIFKVLQQLHSLKSLELEMRNIVSSNVELHMDDLGNFAELRKLTIQNKYRCCGSLPATIRRPVTLKIDKSWTSEITKKIPLLTSLTFKRFQISDQTRNTLLEYSETKQAKVYLIECERV